MENIFTIDVHEEFMSRALELARMGRGKVSPNPMVGCVLVKDGEIIGEGYHKELSKLDKLNRSIDSDNQNIYSFVPFHGTPLRKLCEDSGLVAPGTITKSLTDKPMLIMPQYPQQEIEGLIKCFTLYVKFPQNRWPDTQKAESNTLEGNKIYKELKHEYFEKYLPSINNDLEETPSTSDLEYGLK